MNERYLQIAAIMYELEEVWQSVPNVRFGQLMEYITENCGCNFHMEDMEFAKKIVKFGEETGAFVAPDEEE